MSTEDQNWQQQEPIDVTQAADGLTPDELGLYEEQIAEHVGGVRKEIQPLIDNDRLPDSDSSVDPEAVIEGESFDTSNTQTYSNNAQTEHIGKSEIDTLDEGINSKPIIVNPYENLELPQSETDEGNRPEGRTFTEPGEASFGEAVFDSDTEPPNDVTISKGDNNDPISAADLNAVADLPVAHDEALLYMAGEESAKTFTQQPEEDFGIGIDSEPAQEQRRIENRPNPFQGDENNVSNTDTQSRGYTIDPDVKLAPEDSDEPPSMRLPIDYADVTDVTTSENPESETKTYEVNPDATLEPKDESEPSQIIQPIDYGGLDAPSTPQPDSPREEPAEPDIVDNADAPTEPPEAFFIEVVDEDESDVDHPENTPPEPSAPSRYAAATNPVRKWIGSVREFANRIVGDRVGRIVKAVGYSGAGIVAGSQLISPYVIPALNSSATYGATVGLGIAAAIPTAMGVFRHLNAWRKNVGVKGEFKNLIETTIPDTDPEKQKKLLELVKKQFPKQLKKTLKAKTPKLSTQQMLLAQALLKAGPTPAESRKYIWEKNHCFHSASNLVRLVQIANNLDDDSLKIAGIDEGQIAKYKQRIEDLEPEEQAALQNFKFASPDFVKDITEVGCYYGKLVEENNRKSRDASMSPLVTTTGLIGAGTLFTSGAPLIVAGAPLIGSAIYGGSKGLYNYFNKRNDTIDTKHKEITLASGAPLPPPEANDFSGSLYRKGMFKKIADDPGLNENVKTYANTIRNCITDELDDYKFYDTKEDFGKALAPFAALALTQAAKPAPDKIDAVVKEREDEMIEAERRLKRLENSYSGIENQINRLEYNIDSYENNNPQAAQGAEKHMAIPKEKRPNVDQYDFSTQKLISKYIELENLQSSKVNTDNELNAVSSEYREKKKKHNDALYPKSEGNFEANEAINNIDCQKALAVVVNEKWKEWTGDEEGTPGFFKSLDKIPPVKKTGTRLLVSGGSVVAAGGISAVGASFIGLPVTISAIAGGVAGWYSAQQALNSSDSK